MQSVQDQYNTHSVHVSFKSNTYWLSIIYRRLCIFANLDLTEIYKTKNEISQSEKEDKQLRSRSDNIPFQSMNVDVVLNLLKETKSLHDEADILHYLYETKWDTKWVCAVIMGLL